MTPLRIAAKTVLALLAAVVVFKVGAMDYEDAKREEASTCALVAQGLYPHAAAPYCACPDVTMRVTRYGAATSRRAPGHAADYR